MAASPRTIAAVAPMLASRPVAPATRTVPKGPGAGRKRAGTGSAVEANRLPARDGPGAQVHGACLRRNAGEIIVIARHTNGPADGRIDRPIGEARRALRRVDRGGQQWADAYGASGIRVQAAELAVTAEPAVGGVDVREHLTYRGSRGAKPVRLGGEHVHRGAKRLPAFERPGHHEPPLVTVPLPLLPVVGACVEGCRLLLLLVALELESVLVVVDLGVSAAVADALADDVPAYEAAAT